MVVFDGSLEISKFQFAGELRGSYRSRKTYSISR